MVAVVDNRIVVNIPVAVAMELYRFIIRIDLSSQTKEPIIFTVNVDETSQTSVITVPSDILSGVEKDSTYYAKVGNLIISSHCQN